MENSRGLHRAGVGLGVLLLCGACNSQVKSVELTGDSGEVCSVLGDAHTDTLQHSCIALSPNRNVDLLFVIDNGPHAAGVQARLADSMQTFVDEIESARPRAELRIGFTTSHDGNPACEIGPGSDGNLWLASCREHPEDFVDAEGVDWFQESCATHCSLDAIDVAASEIAQDPQISKRPWIDVGDFVSTLSPEVDLGEAIACASIMGLSGCPFSAPLGSAMGTYASSAQSGHPGFGFFRNNATPILVFVTTGVDCSVNEEGVAAFDPAGDRTLWPDPVATAPTPAVCWNAGVSCTEPSSTGEMTCTPADIGLDGQPADPEAAVLRSVDDFYADMTAIVQQAQMANPSLEAHIFVLTGVPPGLSEADPIVYEAETDPQLLTEYGVRPSCAVEGEPVLPPVRLAALAERSTYSLQVELLSACASDYGPALRRVGQAVAGAARPTCVYACVADVEPEEPGLQVSCGFELTYPKNDGTVGKVLLSRCVEAPDGTLQAPDGEQGCWSPRTEDAMHERCADEGWNLELELVWKGALPGGSSISFDCELSQQREIDCPGLP